MGRKSLPRPEYTPPHTEREEGLNLSRKDSRTSGYGNAACSLTWILLSINSGTYLKENDEGVKVFKESYLVFERAYHDSKNIPWRYSSLGETLKIN